MLFFKFNQNIHVLNRNTFIWNPFAWAAVWAWPGRRGKLYSSLHSSHSMLGFVHPHEWRQSHYGNWARSLNDPRQVSSEAAQVRRSACAPWIVHLSSIYKGFSQPVNCQLLSLVPLPTRVKGIGSRLHEAFASHCVTALTTTKSYCPQRKGGKDSPESRQNEIIIIWKK